MRSRAGGLSLLLLVGALGIVPAAGSSASAVVRVTVVSKNELFTAVVTRPKPVPVGKLHTWTVRLLDRRDRPVLKARIEVTGDMPAHGHGLPTAPVAVSRGGGLYELQGMMFQMPGRWYVQLDVRTARRHDTIRVRFTIAE